MTKCIDILQDKLPNEEECSFFSLFLQKGLLHR